MSPSLPPEPTSGFTAIPRRLLDAALCSDMGKRELYTWLLVARLTYGAQGRRWVTLRPSDLRVIGISPSHAHAVLEGMLARNLLVQNSGKPEYRIAALNATETEHEFSGERWLRLRHLVVRQIGTVTTTAPLFSQNGAFAPTSSPVLGAEICPKREEIGSQEGNASTVPAWAFSRSQRRFVRKVETPIDRVKTKINSDEAIGKEQP